MGAPHARLEVTPDRAIVALLDLAQPIEMAARSGHGPVWCRGCMSIDLRPWFEGPSASPLYEWRCRMRSKCPGPVAAMTTDHPVRKVSYVGGDQRSPVRPVWRLAPAGTNLKGPTP